MSRVAIVTGGTRGIGAAISRRLTREGRRVAAFYNGNDVAAAAARQYLAMPAIRCDVSNWEACVQAVKAVEAELGPVEILVNNAGVTADATLHKMTPEQWRHVISVDLDSLFNVTKQVIGGMRDRGFGRVINISSINGQKGQFGQTNYSAAKAGGIGFTRALALESAGRGVTVNAVAPGYTDTDMVSVVPKAAMDRILQQVPIGRLVEADEIAACVAFLAADEAGAITGSVLSANGGLYMA
jgi:acetoacetyl-CoA reductase